MTICCRLVRGGIRADMTKFGQSEAFPWILSIGICCFSRGGLKCCLCFLMSVCVATASKSPSKRPPAHKLEKSYPTGALAEEKSLRADRSSANNLIRQITHKLRPGVQE